MPDCDPPGGWAWSCAQRSAGVWGGSGRGILQRQLAAANAWRERALASAVSANGYAAKMHSKLDRMQESTRALIARTVDALAKAGGLLRLEQNKISTLQEHLHNIADTQIVLADKNRGLLRKCKQADQDLAQARAEVDRLRGSDGQQRASCGRLSRRGSTPSGGCWCCRSGRRNTRASEWPTCRGQGRGKAGSCAVWAVPWRSAAL